MMDAKTLDKFKRWIENRGGTIEPTTNEYELVRFRGTQVGIIYKSGRPSGTFANDTIHDFRSGGNWRGQPLSSNRKGSYTKHRERLFKRDGGNCWFCGEHMEVDDMTVEHLVSLTQGGRNVLANMVLTHQACNAKLGNRPLAEKTWLAIREREK